MHACMHIYIYIINWIRVRAKMHANYATRAVRDPGTCFGYAVDVRTSPDPPQAHVRCILARQDADIAV